MDATAGVVIFIFVVSIFSSFGGNKGYTPPNVPSGQIYSSVEATVPSHTYNSTDEAVRAAIQKYIAKYRSHDEAIEITAAIIKNSEEYNINPKLVTALIRRESKFNPRAKSSSGAIGLGQLLPSTAKGLKVDDPYDISQNVRGTVRYLRSLIDRFNGNVANAIASYLEGPNAVNRQGGFSGHTKNYVEDILNICQQI
ncbi:hypothetical protein A2311_03870 [candidate division WOR-1 bacterium RIFOXYB2_FULL_48_7]|uniref:Transglycosylase SLT domain-containing protein n=1 Tax=candidate division WOR-1 bacterium RIFOXYB2_FULL_48_7 TaxID=1802583 RepID=A0A1F4T8H5_UNCSA|nr:MAG: hypothetical protein A2311_03870 [candidate division WOR-1 bacterium RIFOXYB2_FULL_48_7]